jgi:hypothetical protein
LYYQEQACEELQNGECIIYEGTTQAVYEVIFIVRPVMFNNVKLSF